MTTVQAAALQSTVSLQNAVFALSEAARARLETRPEETGARYRGVWVVLLGIFVIAAAIAWTVCLARGYRGFTGRLEFARGPFGITIGIKLGCY